MTVDPTATSFWRRFWPPLVLGLLGLGALALQLRAPLQTVPRPPELADLPLAALLVMALIGPLILLALGSLLGAALAHRTGLRSWAAGTGSRPPAAALREAALMGLVLAVVLYLADLLLWARMAHPVDLLGGQARGSGMQLFVGILYGGLTEEVMVRWGLLSLFAWALQWLARRSQSLPSAGVLWTANVLAAVLFAVGHLPALAAMVEPTPLLIARTVVLNTVAGLVYGWLFWRRQLESAMVAHACTHLGLWLLTWMTS